jgi:hypothetical protein
VAGPGILPSSTVRVNYRLPLLPTTLVVYRQIPPLFTASGTAEADDDATDDCTSRTRYQAHEAKNGSQTMNGNIPTMARMSAEHGHQDRIPIVVR